MVFFTSIRTNVMNFNPLLSSRLAGIGMSKRVFNASIRAFSKTPWLDGEIDKSKKLLKKLLKKEGALNTKMTRLRDISLKNNGYLGDQQQKELHRLRSDLARHTHRMITEKIYDQQDKLHKLSPSEFPLSRRSFKN